MTNKLKYRQDFSVTINNTEYQLTCYCQRTSTGFRHLCFFTNMCEDDEANTKDYIAKCTYVNRTWDEYPYQVVLWEAVNKIIKERSSYIAWDAMDTVRRVNS